MSGNIPFRDDRTLAYLNIEGADRPLKSPLPGDTLDRACRLANSPALVMAMPNAFFEVEAIFPTRWQLRGS